VNEDTLKALNETGVPYIEKPFRVQELMATVEKIFGKAQ
jgi:DNA-binding response OmpR family regulator